MRLNTIVTPRRFGFVAEQQTKTAFPSHGRAVEALDLAIREATPRPCGLEQPQKRQVRAGLSVIGRPPNRLTNNQIPNPYWRLANDYLMVPADSLQRAQKEVPEQDDSWSCGPNSAARAMVAAGNTVTDYVALRDTFVTHFDWIPFVNAKTGPTPGELYNDLRGGLGGRRTQFAPGLYLRCEEFPKEAMEEIQFHLQRQRPLVALMSFGSMNQHYVVICRSFNLI